MMKEWSYVCHSLHMVNLPLNISVHMLIQLCEKSDVIM
jgi:hypothetical protein